MAEDRLFATLDPTTRQIELPGGKPLLLTDTVGFIQKLPTQLIAAFRATLEEINEADVLLHVLDITHANAQEQEQVVEATLRELGVRDRPIITVLNKIDQIEGVHADNAAGMAVELGLPADFVAVSARCGWGLEQLRERIEQTLAAAMVELDALIPYQRNDLVSLWHERGVVASQEYGETGTHVIGRVPRELSYQFTAFVQAG